MGRAMPGVRATGRAPHNPGNFKKAGDTPLEVMKNTQHADKKKGVTAGMFKKGAKA